MELRQLKTFRTVADNLSFTKTAEQLFMAQSSVSAQIRALEETLEVKLFDRIGRRVLLTDPGRKLYEYARRMEDMTQEIRSEVTGSEYARGSLTIRIPETLATAYMPGVVQCFHEKNPGVKLIFINCSDLQLSKELNSGRIDLAFLMTEAIHLKDVNIHMLKTENLILVSSPAHPLAGQEQVRLQDLDGKTLLLSKTD